MGKSQLRLFEIANGAFLIVFSLIVLFPFWQLVVLSFTSSADATSLGLHIWPRRWVTEAYQYLFTADNIVRPYINSGLRTVAGTALEVLFTVLAAYPLAKKNLPFRGWITTLFIVPLFFSGGLIPYYLLVRDLGLIDNFLVLIVPTAVSIFSIIIMRNYFMSLDVALEESAIIDGAGYLTVLFKVIVPVSAPVMATITLWAAVAHWNAWFDAMIFIRDRDLTVIQVIMREMLMAVSGQYADIVVNPSRDLSQLSLASVRSGIALLSIGPIVLVYPLLQRYFIKGIMLGSLKG